MSDTKTAQHKNRVRSRATTKCLCNGRVRCPHYFRFLYLHCVVGQVATGRSWHSASLHCQALLVRPLHKHHRCAQARDSWPTARLLSKFASTARAHSSSSLAASRGDSLLIEISTSVISSEIALAANGVRDKAPAALSAF